MAEHATRRSNAAHIAVIDDDDSVRQAMKSLIALMGYSVDAFSSAEAFLDSGEIATTDCVIADVQLPGMSGVELQHHLSVEERTPPLIFVTAYPDETIRARVLCAGAVGYLTKPLREENLLTCLDKALGLG